MNGHEKLEAQVAALVDRMNRRDEWCDGIDQERIRSVSQRDRLDWRVALLERVQWGAVALALSCLGLELFKLLEKKP